MSMKMKHFNINEFTCRCGCSFNNIKDELLEKLEKARENAGVPFIITSGCRCEKHNKNVGGVPNSNHCLGEACDIAVNDENRDMILNALKSEFSRIGIADNFIHVDIDKAKVKTVWFYEREVKSA